MHVSRPVTSFGDPPHPLPFCLWRLHLLPPFSEGCCGLCGSARLDAAPHPLFDDTRLPMMDAVLRRERDMSQVRCVPIPAAGAFSSRQASKRAPANPATPGGAPRPPTARRIDPNVAGQRPRFCTCALPRDRPGIWLRCATGTPPCSPGNHGAECACTADVGMTRPGYPAGARRLRCEKKVPHEPATSVFGGIHVRYAHLQTHAPWCLARRRRQRAKAEEKGTNNVKPQMGKLGTIAGGGLVRPRSI